jgi:hypothetical protein
MSDMIPLEWAIVEGFVLLAAAIFCFVKWQGSADTSPEGKVYSQGRAEGRPVLDVVDISTGHGKVYLGDKDEDGDPYFDIPGLPMKIDPSMCTGDARPERYTNGLNVWHFASAKALPLSVDTMLSFKTMSFHRNDKASTKLLKDIPDNELFSLIRLSKGQLAKAAVSYIARYKIQAPIMSGEPKREMDINEFVEIIEQMKSVFAAMPVETGFYCKDKAFASIPYAHSSQDIERIKYLLEAKAELKNANNERLMQYAFMFVMVLAGLGGLVAILLVLGK